jgi:hypothetical protein
MTGNVLSKVRSFIVRGLAVVAVVATYAIGNIGAQIATSVGVSAVALTSTATPANAWWRRGGWGGWGRRGWGRGWRRGWRR